MCWREDLEQKIRLRWLWGWRENEGERGKENVERKT